MMLTVLIVIVLAVGVAIASVLIEDRIYGRSDE
jgi:hypothetical protein